MRSSSAVFERLPRDNSSKSLVVSIEDVSKNLEANDDDLEMEYDLSNIDNLIKEILQRISVNKSLESKIIMNQNELSEKNHLTFNDSAESELSEIFNEIKSDEAANDFEIVKDREMKLIHDTIERVKQIEEKTDVKSTDTYYFKGKQIFPEPNNDSSSEFNIKVAEFDADNKKVRFEDDTNDDQEVKNSPRTKKKHTKKSVESIKFQLTDSDEAPNYDKFVRVDETDSYVEFAKEEKESYDPRKFIQVEWDDELLELNADIYRSIKKKKVCLERRESSSKANELKKRRSSLSDLEETLHDIKFDPPKKLVANNQPKPVVKQSRGPMGKIKSIFRKKNKVSPPQENTKEIFVDAKYKKKFRMENIKKKLRK